MAQTDRFFFERYGLTEADLEHYLAAALSEGGEYADLYFEHTTSASILVDESLVTGESKTFEITLTPNTITLTDSTVVTADPFTGPQESAAGFTLQGDEQKNLASVLSDDPLRAVQIPSPIRQRTATWPTSSICWRGRTAPRGPTIPAFAKSGPPTATRSATSWWPARTGAW